MEYLLYLCAQSLITLVRVLPWRVVARLGRALGGLAYWLDGRHRRVALQNLALCFGAEKSPAQIRALARENFRRLGENFSCGVKAAFLTPAETRHVLEAAHFERLQRAGESPPRGRVIAIGHFGNFELYAHARQFAPEFQLATTYRALRQPLLDRLFQGVRQRSGCLFFERRTETRALRQAMARRRLMIGFLSDQHAGDKGLWLPFLGQACSTTAAPAVFALRYGCPLHPAICYRVAPGRWRIEMGEEIPARLDGRPRPVAAIMLDVNRAFEAAVRRDPANWFWVHNRWKPVKSGAGEPGGAAAGAPAPRPQAPAPAVPALDALPQ
jgi:KDO2-lipid IV(A) lauroyltransferase